MAVDTGFWYTIWTSAIRKQLYFSLEASHALKLVAKQLQTDTRVLPQMMLLEVINVHGAIIKLVGGTELLKNVGCTTPAPI
jgi:hypothetical protein